MIWVFGIFVFLSFFHSFFFFFLFCEREFCFSCYICVSDKRERSTWSKLLLFIPGAITFGLGTWQIFRRQDKVKLSSSIFVVMWMTFNISGTGNTQLFRMALFVGGGRNATT